MMMSEALDHALPFGKYRGKTIFEVSYANPAYLDWLEDREWLSKKYPKIREALTIAVEEPGVCRRINQSLEDWG